MIFPFFDIFGDSHHDDLNYNDYHVDNLDINCHDFNDLANYGDICFAGGHYYLNIDNHFYPVQGPIY